MRRSKLSEIAIALESSAMDGEHITRFDRETGEMVYLEGKVLCSVEEDPDYDGDDLPDWQRKEIGIARALLTDDGARFIDPPHRDPHDEFESMREFAEKWPDKTVSSELLEQLGGRGSFRRFRETVFEHRIEDEWRTFQGKISGGSMGPDVFVAERDRYIGRACQYREPWPRADCISRKLRCADGREFLCDTSANFTLDQGLIDNPPVILWPKARQNADVPADVQELLSALSPDALLNGS